jgi:AsmA protein
MLSGISLARETTMKKLAIVFGICVLVVIVVLAILPLLINANSFKPRVQAALTQALGRPVTIGDLSASIFSGGIRAESISIADDPAFEQQAFIDAKSLKIGVDLGALIFSRKVNVRSLTLQSPQVRLLQNQAGHWNFASLGGQKNPKSNNAGAKTSSGDEISVDKLKIEGGEISIGQIGETIRTYTDVSLTADNLSYTSAFPFTLHAKTPGGGSLTVDGNAGPINQQDASATPLQAKITAKDINLAATGFTDPKSGIAGTADFTGNLQSNGSQMQSHGDVNIKNAKFAPAAQPSAVPITVQYAANYNVAKQTADITSGTIHIGKATAQLTGTVDLHPASPVVNAKLIGKGMPVDQLQDALPAFGVVLPPSTQLSNGTADANFTASGPLNNTVIQGNAALSNAKLANFDLGGKMKTIGALAGISSSKDTTIQTLSANLRNTKQGTQVNDLNLLVPTIGAITGQGTIAADNALDFHLAVKLTNQASAVGVLSQVANVGGGNGIPVSVKGTTQNPQFIPDVGGLVKSQLTSPTNVQKNVGGLVQGLFGKKKKP